MAPHLRMITQETHSTTVSRANRKQAMTSPFLEQQFHRVSCPDATSLSPFLQQNLKHNIRKLMHLSTVESKLILMYSVMHIPLCIRELTIAPNIHSKDNPEDERDNKGDSSSNHKDPVPPANFPYSQPVK